LLENEENVEESFETELDRLAALQVIDREIKKRQENATTLRSEVDKICNELERCREAVGSLSTERDELESQRANFEEKLREEEQKIKRSRMRMARIRNEHELLATQHEINVSKEATQQHEDQLLMVMEQLEEVEGKLAEARTELEGIEGQSAGETDSREEELGKLDQAIAVQHKRREVLIQGMDDSLRAKYELIFARRGGEAVVEVRDGTCLGCRMRVPPQLFNELRKSREVRQCPSCHRILFWQPPEEDVRSL